VRRRKGPWKSVRVGNPEWPQVERKLPAPLSQAHSTVGRDVVVTEADGSTIVYGPCHRPPSIDAIGNVVSQTAPEAT